MQRLPVSDRRVQPQPGFEIQQRQTDGNTGRIQRSNRCGSSSSMNNTGLCQRIEQLTKGPLGIEYRIGKTGSRRKNGRAIRHMHHVL
jgi:hypothetical protein